MSASIGVIDLFAGPGGLGEGFSSIGDVENRSFEIAMSVEKDSVANRTLLLRAFLRKYQQHHNKLPPKFIDFHAGLIPEPDWEEMDKEAWQSAGDEVCELELGTSEAREKIDAEIVNIHKNFNDTILIGGPPCQAYSIVGRVRSRSNKNYVPEKDERQYLFREYIGVIDKLRPAIFLMENVKGMLSSSIKSRKVFEMLMENLASLGTTNDHLYDLRSIVVEENKAYFKESSKPSDYIIRAEKFGIPQRRHRVFIVGIRSDLSSKASEVCIEIDNLARSVNDVIGTLPNLRSGISKGQDNSKEWLGIVSKSAKSLSLNSIIKENAQLLEIFKNIYMSLNKNSQLTRFLNELPKNYGSSNDELMKWIENKDLKAIAQHETRGHMASDLKRYLFASAFGRVNDYSPKASDFPSELSPNHRNWNSGKFNDRFRVQLENKASTTITCHISKDGHYFIHPDPYQCRSLTVREAARLQTFPDDYLFLGNRTQQYVQVGNAVPPYLARQIALLISKVLN
ncbi:MAG: DNA cytosine methyltransferase [Paracoccaceae bacterium]|nr:DNA cytosine methyltransferase [Paracoccaceae bacterium]MDE2673556.1 DNA cytosine methyltransferase [Paracoccaceae bacterium]